MPFKGTKLREREREINVVFKLKIESLSAYMLIIQFYKYHNLYFINITI